MMKVIGIILVFVLSGCGDGDDTTITKHTTYGVSKDQWAVCTDSCGESGLSGAIYGAKAQWLKCLCSDLSQIEIKLPVESTVIEKAEEE
jgi:hypothetical protein